MDRKQILLDSIKKLLSLNIPDGEIISNLKEVGLTTEESKGLLGEAKGKPKKLDRIVQKELRSAAPATAPEVPPPSAKTKSPLPKQPVPSPPAKISRTEAEKALAGGGLDAMIRQRIQEQMQAELKKVQVLLDSQHELFSDKIESGLEEKSKEILESIDSKLAEMKDLSKKTEETLDKLSRRKEEDQAAAIEVTAKIDELQQLKEGFENSLKKSKAKLSKELDQLISEEAERIVGLEDKMNAAVGAKNNALNTDIETLKQQMQQLQHTLQQKMPSQPGEETKGAIENLQQRIAAIDEKVSHPDLSEGRLGEEVSSLHKRVEDMSQKMNTQLDQKLSGLEKSIDLLSGKISTQGKVDVSPLENRISDLEEKFAASSQNGQLEEKINRQLNAALSEREEAMTQLLEEKIKSVQTVSLKGLDLDRAKTLMEELDTFKEQFIATVDKNVAELKKARKDLDDSVGSNRKAVKELSQELKLKLAELDAFEDKFAKEMGVVVDKAIEQKTTRSKKGKKGKRK